MQIIYVDCGLNNDYSPTKFYILANSYPLVAGDWQTAIFII